MVVWMCSGVPSVFRCLVDAMAGCNSSDATRRINETLEATLRNMTAQCPQSCDPTTGYNCSMNYYDRVVMSFVNGVDCPILGGYDNRYYRYYLRRRSLCFYFGLFVCLSVRPSDNWKSCERILTKFLGGVGHGPGTKGVNLMTIRITIGIHGSGSRSPKSEIRIHWIAGVQRRSVLSEYFYLLLLLCVI